MEESVDKEIIYRLRKDKFFRTDEFRTEAMQFEEKGYYCKYSPSSIQGRRYWDEQTRRCIHGYHAGHDWVPGYFYFYLNFCPIIKAVALDESELISGASTRVMGTLKREFPDFWDGDAIFFNYVDEAYKSGLHCDVLKRRRGGYEQPNSEPVLTPDGFVPMGDIRIGDSVIGSSGKKIEVLDVIPQGVSKVFNVILQDGREVRCGENHLWEVVNGRGDVRIVNTRYLIKNKLKHGSVGKKRYSYRIRQASPVEFNVDESNLPIDPYILGFVLGDGCMVTSPMCFSSDDQEIVDYISDNIGEDIRIEKCESTPYRYNIKSNIKSYNRYNRTIKNLGLNVKSYDKRIPHDYKYASISDRFKIVMGLMDADGSVTNDGSCRFSNTSEGLVDDLAWILRSLGIRCRKSKTNQGGKLSYFNTNGNTSVCRDLWSLSITTYDQIFMLERKASVLDRVISNRRLLNQSFVGISDVVDLGYSEDSTCIYVDSDDHLYLTRDFVVTHNSLKCSAMLNRNYFLIPYSKSYAVAYEKEYLVKDGILTKAWSTMDFIDQNTAWTKHRSKKDSDMHRRASREVKVGGARVERGFMSEIIGLSLKDDPDKIRGKIGNLIIFEEKGKFPGLSTAWGISIHSMKQDGIVFGTMISIGTGGEDGSDFVAAEKFFKKPKGFDIMPVENTWEKNGQPCSLFVPGYMNYKGCMDKDGNTDKDEAIKRIEKTYEEKARESDDPEAVMRARAEMPITPADAMMRIGGTLFPVDDLKDHQSNVETNVKKYRDSEYVGNINWNNDKEEWEWSPSDSLYPIREYPLIGEKVAGAPVIYAMPEKNKDGVVPHGLFIAGIDSYDHDESTTNSLGSIIIMNKLTSEIVAEYTGRPSLAETFYETCRRLLLFFNARANYENFNKGILTYFEHHHCDYLLVDTPKNLREVVKDSKSSRNKGTHPTVPIQRWGRSLIKKWLLEPHPDMSGKLMLHTIKSTALLDELIYWNPGDNFDRVDALCYLMILRDELYLYTPEVGSNRRNAADDMGDMFDKAIKSSNNYMARRRGGLPSM